MSHSTVMVILVEIYSIFATCGCGTHTRVIACDLMLDSLNAANGGCTEQSVSHKVAVVWEVA